MPALADSFHNPHATTDFKVPWPDDVADVYPKGRVCSSDRCGTVLSIYNKGPACHCCTRKAARKALSSNLPLHLSDVGRYLAEFA